MPSGSLHLRLSAALIGAVLACAAFGLVGGRDGIPRGGAASAGGVPNLAPLCEPPAQPASIESAGSSTTASGWRLASDPVPPVPAVEPHPRTPVVLALAPAARPSHLPPPVRVRFCVWLN